MNATLLKLLDCLSDGQFHSGEELGTVAGVSRAAVWKQLQQLQAWGIALESQKSRGYQIAGGLQLLNQQAILASLLPETQALITEIVVHPEIESTNAELLAAIAGGDNVHAQVCVAERQTAGRGRRGRVWQSPFGRNLYFSIAWRFEQGIAAMEGLSLAIGVALCKALEPLGYANVQLKWPNDLLVTSRKLGGVLLEIAGDVSGDCYVVVGVGLNVVMPLDAEASIDQPFTDLASINEAPLPERNQLLAALLNQIVPLLETYHKRRFIAYRDEWQQRNAHEGQRVSLVSAQQAVQGEMLGVSDSGALMLKVDGEVREFVGGELSLRAAP